ncbi:hypothetical protein BDN71DRAFT_1431606 [Pleurotus eryngii]|uniref:Uncharacterized protein n=1 Tax=Pleurotus eryngii TaxID=5323 RepID=A0A9P5ZUE8_PLEER|nr:hypothetical protein BDN71DRAFT_1431606 [Pleurotus eryngii]
MTATNSPIPPEPGQGATSPLTDPELVDFDKDPADKPFNTNNSTLTSMHNLTSDNKQDHDSTAKPIPHPGFWYLSVSDDTPYYFIFTKPNSKQKYQEPELPKSVLFPVIESNRLVTHTRTFPPGPFLLGLRDHAQHLKFHKKKAAAPTANPASLPPHDLYKDLYLMDIQQSSLKY